MYLIWGESLKSSGVREMGPAGPFGHVCRLAFEILRPNTATVAMVALPLAIGETGCSTQADVRNNRQAIV